MEYAGQTGNEEDSEWKGGEERVKQTDRKNEGERERESHLDR